MCKIGEHYCRDDDRYIRDTLRPPCRLKDPAMDGEDKSDGDDDELGSNKVVTPSPKLFFTTSPTVAAFAVTALINSVS